MSREGSSGRRGLLVLWGLHRDSFLNCFLLCSVLYLWPLAPADLLVSSLVQWFPAGILTREALARGREQGRSWCPHIAASGSKSGSSASPPGLHSPPSMLAMVQLLLTQRPCLWALPWSPPMASCWLFFQSDISALPSTVYSIPWIKFPLLSKRREVCIFLSEPGWYRGQIKYLWNQNMV